MRLCIFTLIICLHFLGGWSGCCLAQENYPSANPKMEIEEEGVLNEYTEFEGSAPVSVSLTANPENLNGYIPYYEWRIYAPGKESAPEVLRFDENIHYIFTQSGSFYIKLYVSFVQGTDTIHYEIDEPYMISVSTSKLEMPNAFSPNGDGQNDVYKVKEGYQSIISFHAYIFNRWGKRIYEWTDISQGWDGTINGNNAPAGVYYCLVKAKGADGKSYNIKKDINLLRGYGEANSTTE